LHRPVRIGTEDDESKRGRRDSLLYLVWALSFLFLTSAVSLAADITPLNPGIPGNDSSKPDTRAPDCGISGAMVAAWGNAPANPPTYQCVKIFDSSGRHLIATGVCSGVFASFRVPLSPGRYLVDYGPTKSAPGMPVTAQRGSFAVVVNPGQWVKLKPKSPPGPVP
jgi:hypothetical protein